MKVTKEWLKKESACEEGLRFFIRNFGERAELRDVICKLALEVKIDWAIWLLDHAKVVRILRLFAADCAENVLDIFEKKYPQDGRPRAAIAAVRQFAAGKTTKEQLASAWDAAWDAEKKWQCKKLTEYFTEEDK